ncbi:hypothetical protein VNO77_27509 [Canavalia gladiata]|uniref:Uncharacterized protein n=1 Tax=Canavalia gladiata TaxID=3824 RepID=A0AAN9Q754_CANGL
MDQVVGKHRQSTFKGEVPKSAPKIGLSHPKVFITGSSAEALEVHLITKHRYCTIRGLKNQKTSDPELLPYQVLHVPSPLMTSPKSISNFGHHSNQSKGSVLGPLSTSLLLSLVASDFTSQDLFSNSSAATSSGISKTVDIIDTNS